MEIAMRTRLQELLGIKYPIVQAPLAGSDNPELVAAACNAGVLGSFGAQYLTPDEIRKALARIRSLTDKPFAVNLFSQPRKQPPGDHQIAEESKRLSKYYAEFGISTPLADAVKTGIDPDAQFQAILEARVAVFSFTLGIPNPDQIKELKKASIILIGTATNVKEARALAAAQVDAITAQGSEAGGHRGTFAGEFEDSMIGLMALVPQVVDAVDIPVIAAGGIMDGRGIAAALALGAEGVQMGTAFLTVEECAVHQNYKLAVQNHDADDTTITDVFSGAPARGIKNKFIAENTGRHPLPFPFQNALTRPIRNAANKTGQIEYTNLWSGQAGRLARRVSTKELIGSLMSETKDVLNKLATDSA
jgi:nitronate monooxygenase